MLTFFAHNRVRCVSACAVVAIIAAAAHVLPARAAGTLPVTDSISARLSSHHGANVLYEKGRATGTLACPALTIQINISYTHAHVWFNCPTSSGDVSGEGETSFYASGSLAYFHGALTVRHGTGRYAHSAGSGLTIKGTLHRGSYAIGASVTGSLKL